MLQTGDPIPSLYLRTGANPCYSLDSVAGRHVLLTVIGSTRVQGVNAYLDQVYKAASLFDDENICCFVVVNDADDERAAHPRDRVPGIRVAWDTDFALVRAMECVVEEQVAGRTRLSLVSYILDPGLRVLHTVPMVDPTTHFDEIRRLLAPLTEPAPEWQNCAPVLIIPNVFESALCRDYIDYAEHHGLEQSGFMQTDAATGKTVMAVDHNHKRRSDCTIEDVDLRQALVARVMRRLVPQIERAFQFRVTRMERYLIARYEAGQGGWFRPHKDNTTLGTAHRRFAVSINLNAEDFDGGDLRFPEFGRRTYRPPTGGAIVFSCSLLHEAMPVTRGSRYCVLPFLYDEAAAQMRLDNAQHLSDPELARDVVRSVTAAPGWFEKKGGASGGTPWIPAVPV